MLYHWCRGGGWGGIGGRFRIHWIVLKPSLARLTAVAGHTLKNPNIITWFRLNDLAKLPKGTVPCGIQYNSAKSVGHQLR